MRRDAERLDRLVRDHGTRVARYLARRASDPEDAADVFQATMTVAWRKIRTIPADDDLAVAWLIATAHRCLANHRRAERRRTEATERLAAELERHPVRPDDDVDPDLTDAVAALPADQREVIELVYRDGLTAEQAAVIVGIGAAACRKRLQRARDALRSALSAPATDRH